MKHKWISETYEPKHGRDKKWTCGGWELYRFNRKYLNDPDLTGYQYDLYTPSGEKVNFIFDCSSDAKQHAEGKM